MIQYDPKKDRSEQFGWKKVKDEQIPTEQEQDQWSAIIILFTLGIIIIGFLGGIYGIQ
jgi:hypothetical protein